MSGAQAKRQRATLGSGAHFGRHSITRAVRQMKSEKSEKSCKLSISSDNNAGRWDYAVVRGRQKRRTTARPT